MSNNKSLLKVRTIVGSYSQALVETEERAYVEKCHQRNIWQYLRQHRVASIFIGHVIVAMVLGLAWLGGPSLLGAFAQAPCAAGDQTYVVANGDTLGSIASHYSTSLAVLASHNHIANPNLIYVNQHICIPGHGGSISVARQPLTDQMPNGIAAVGHFNVFPYGQCTWWASQRYYQLHGVFVPWTTNANAWQWTARASDFHWRISSQPMAGAIVNLQPYVQGASGLGHVAVVEQVLGNGHVIASNLNWGATPGRVVTVEFASGPGVTFLTV